MRLSGRGKRQSRRRSALGEPSSALPAIKFAFVVSSVSLLFRFFFRSFFFLCLWVPARCPRPRFVTLQWRRSLASCRPIVILADEFELIVNWNRWTDFLYFLLWECWLSWILLNGLLGEGLLIQLAHARAGLICICLGRINELVDFILVIIAWICKDSGIVEFVYIFPSKNFQPGGGRSLGPSPSTKSSFPSHFKLISRVKRRNNCIGGHLW